MAWSRTDRLLIPALVLLNIMLKCAWLDISVLAHDEPFTVYWSQRPSDELWSMFATENNPPLYFLLIKVWGWVTPFTAGWLRLPSALFSAFSAWPLFLLGHRLAGRAVAICAALLFTFSNYHYGFAHEVRAYSLFTLLATTGMWLVWRAKDKPNNGLRAMLGLSALNTLLVYTHFFGWLAIGLQGLCLFALPELRHLRRNFLFGTALTIGWFSPYLIIFWKRMGSSVSQGTWLEAPVLEELYNMVWRWSNEPVLTIIFLIVIAVACVRDRPLSPGLRLALVWTFVPLVGMFLVSLTVPMFLDRYLVYAAPGFALLVAVSVAHLGAPSGWTSGFAVLLVAGMAITFTPWRSGVRDPARVVQAVDAWCREDCEVEIVPGWYWLNYLAAEDLEQLKDDHTDLLLSEVLIPDAAIGEVLGPTVVVDASGDVKRSHQGWYRSLRSVYPIIDSIEADHRIWVYRFRR